MFAEERYVKIIELIKELGKITVAELSEIMEVSAVTIRRDLEKLEEQNLIMRTHGGAMPIGSGAVAMGMEQSFSEKEVALVREKNDIAEAASLLVQEGEAILLTPGTTNMLLAKKLLQMKEITIVTNAVNIATYILDQSALDVVLLGGSMRKKSYATVGSIAEQSLKHIRVNKLFLGVDGIDLKEGLTTPNLSEANINRQMIDIAKEVVVVADHSKFGRVTFSKMASMNVIHTIVTDRQLSQHYIQQIREMGIHLILV